MNHISSLHLKKMIERLDRGLCFAVLRIYGFRFRTGENLIQTETTPLVLS